MMGGLFHHRLQLTSTFLVFPDIDFNPNYALDKYSKNLRETAQKKKRTKEYLPQMNTD
jgi:hypothetical protein